MRHIKFCVSVHIALKRTVIFVCCAETRPLFFRRMVCGNYILHNGAYIGAFADGRRLEDRKLCLKLAVIHFDGSADMDKLVIRGLQSLLVHEQLRIQLFARAQSRIFYHYIHVGHVAGKTYKVSRHIVYTHGVAHVKHEYLAACGVVRRLKHKRYRLGYGHKIADDIFIGNGNGAARGYLLFEQGYDAAV